MGGLVNNGTLSNKDNRVLTTNGQLEGLRVQVQSQTDQCSTHIPLIVSLNQEIERLQGDLGTLLDAPTGEFIIDLAERLGVVNPAQFLVTVLEPILRTRITDKEVERHNKGEPCRQASAQSPVLNEATSVSELIVNNLGEEVRIGERETISFASIQATLEETQQTLERATAETGMTFDASTPNAFGALASGNGAESFDVTNNENLTSSQQENSVGAGNGTTSVGQIGEAGNSGTNGRNIASVLNGNGANTAVVSGSGGTTGLGVTAQSSPLASQRSSSSLASEQGLQIDFNGTPIGVQQSAIFGTLSEAYERADLY